MNNIRFIYGAGFVQVDVTEKAVAEFIKDGKLFIAKSASFNGIFSDVIPREPKTLMIQFEDKSFICLPEVRGSDYTVMFA